MLGIMPGRHGQERLLSVVFLIPALLILLVASVYPLGYSLVLSFHTWNMSIPNSRAVFRGFDKYAALLRNGEFAASVQVTMVFVAVAVAIEFVVGLAVAMLVTSPRLHGVGAVRTALLVPVMIPYFVVLRTLQLSDTHEALILTYISYCLPFVIWLMLGFFQDMPPDIEEAAIVDGCSLWQRFTQVVLPLALPRLAVTAVFAFVFAWNEFLYASILTSFNAKTLPVVISGYISDKFLRWGEMSALGTAMVLPVVLFSAFVQRYLVRGLTFGAVKEWPSRRVWELAGCW
jgi:multiple sugar transport system permease protein